MWGQRIQAPADLRAALLPTLFTSLQKYEWNGFSRKDFREHKGILSPGRPCGGPVSRELGLCLKSIRPGISMNMLGPTAVCVCMCVGGCYLLKCFLFLCQAHTEIQK